MRASKNSPNFPAKRIFPALGILFGIAAALLLWTLAKSGLAWQIGGGQGWDLFPGDQGNPLVALVACQEQGQPPAPPIVPPHNKTQPSPPGQAKADSDSAWPTHPLIQALLDTLDAFHGEGTEAKDLLRDRLHQADRQLQPLLRSRKQQILQANRKRVLPLIEERLAPPSSKQGSSTPQKAPQSGKGSSGSASPGPASSPNPSSSSTLPSGAAGPSPTPTKSAPQGPQSTGQGAPSLKVQTELVRSLLDTLEKLPEVSEEEKRPLRQLLLEADQELAQTLNPPSVKRSSPPKPVAPSTKPD